MRRDRRDISLLAAGTLVSVAGDSVAMVALLLELKSSGVGWVSAALGAELVPFVLLAPLSGRLTDRVDNRRLLVTGLLGQAVVAVPLALVRIPWVVVALFFALNAASTTTRPAANALVPALTGEAGAKSGYAWVATGNSIGFTLGPAVGGLLTASSGVTSAILVDAATFVVTAVACSLLSTTRKPSADHDPDQPRHGGMRIVRRDAVLRWSIAATAIAVACAVVDNVAAPFRYLDQLHTSSSAYGAYLTLWGVGALAGAQIPRRISAAGVPVALAVGNGLSGLGIVGIGLAPALWVAFVASVAGGVGNGIANVSVNVLISNRIVEAERGRAFAAVGALIQTGVGVGTAAGAPLVAALGAGHAMTAAGGLAALLAAITAWWTASGGSSRTSTA